MKNVIQYFTAVLLIFLIHGSQGIDCGNKTGECGPPITVNWWSIPPFIYKENGIVKGILPSVLDLIVKNCCGECQKIVYMENNAKSESTLVSRIENSTDISLPVYGKMATTQIGDHLYYPLVESPGILYIMDNTKDIDSTVSGALLRAISNAWPVVCFTYLAAAISGIIMWALDSYRNPGQFKGNFFKGSWDGFWWACVSMTTVGYGDRTPKSFTARIYAFAWVLVGLVIIAIFNASMTASLTSVSMTSNKLMEGEEVVAIKDTYEMQYASGKNVKLRGAGDFWQLRSILLNKSESVYGALLDSYVAGYYKNELLPKNGFRIADVIEDYFTYGLLWSRGKINDDKKTKDINRKTKKCFMRYTSLYQLEINQVIQSLSQALDMPKVSIQEERSTSILSTKYDWYIEIVCVCCGIIGVYLLFGFAKEAKAKYQSYKINKRKDIKREEDFVKTPKETTMEELLQRQNNELESMMAQEIEYFFNVWSNKKKQIQLLTSKFSIIYDPFFEVTNQMIMKNKQEKKKKEEERTEEKTENYNDIEKTNGTPVIPFDES